ncbi:MAG TPA: hypothetical protein VHM89_13435 [Acidimicrobiales bacterium]|nr:hypothetical protein [Acidimicrobiales bacterium]
MDDTTQIIEQLRAMATDQAYFSASRVQSILFDLYGVVGTDEAKRLVETWLTLTIQRDLFSGAELLEMLDDLESRLTSRVSG